MTTSPSPPNPHPPRAPQRHHTLRHPAAGETTLYLVRHGRTASNVDRVFHGVTDVPLDPFGVRQAHAVADRLAREARVDAVLTSPLSRALETARTIGARFALNPIVVPGLVEIDFGELEGSPIDRFAEDYPDLAIRFIEDEDGDVAWPGGESRRSFSERVQTAFTGILQEYAAHRVVVVAHGGVIGSFLARLLGISPNAPEAYDIMNCSLSHLDVTPEHTTLHSRNDVVHLEVLEEPGSDVEVIV